ncbi:MAG: methyltransferase domain-containing protein [Erysipelotrichaceae bacterium]|nr:methyltransferase domain-containing protein [Erysipelotrichaceae bacterium]
MKQRELALDILYRSIKEESYSNLLMRKELEKIDSIQRPFVTNLVNGVLRNYEFLIYQFEEDTKEKTSLRTKLIICMALFERFYNHEKDYVVNNEYVELGKNKYEKAYINALLHKMKDLKQAKKDYQRCCLPEWIFNLLKSQYDEDEFEKIIEVYRTIPEVYYRLNKKKGDYTKLKDLKIDIVNEDIFTGKENLLNSEEYKKGFFYVQDFNSASLYKHLDLQEDDSLLDMCAAPGSKLFNCLDIVNEENVFGNDLHENRVELIRKMAKKLGYEKIHLSCHDARKLDEIYENRFDKILLDAPCSGLGVIGRKPDLKFHIRPESLDELQKLQSELLESADRLLNSGGIMLYSTCTLNKKENARLVKKFLEGHDELELLEEETIINSLGDCFYYAKIRKVA